VLTSGHVETVLLDQNRTRVLHPCGCVRPVVLATHDWVWPDLKRQLALVCGTLAILWVACLFAPRVCKAQSPVSAISLVPAAHVGFVELSAFTLDARLLCVDSACSLAVEQRYRYTNTDRVKAAELRLQLNRSGADDVPAQVNCEPAAEASEAETWRLTLGPSASGTAVLRYDAPLQGPHLIYWSWDPASLAGWGAPVSTRITFRLPAAIPDDAFLARAPEGYTFTGRELDWSYEGPVSPKAHRLWMISPGTWARHADLETRGATIEWVVLLQEIASEAMRRGAPYPDPYSRSLGVLLSTLAVDPSPQTYLALADLYLARAGEPPEANYRLLAAETLELAVQSGHADAVVIQRLSTAYRGLAEIARAAGDSKQALHYLQLEADLSSGGVVDSATLEELTLGWAVDLASRGHTSDALVEVGSDLSPRVQDALYRYAPPIRSARTEVALTEERRTATYYLLPYPPVAQITRARLGVLVESLVALPGCSAQLSEPAGESQELELRVTLSYVSPEDYAEKSAAIYALAGQEPDFVTALILAPWSGTAKAYGVSRTPWYDRYVYEESPGLGLVPMVRDQQLEYTRWRLVEIASETPADERARLEQQLTGLALRDERQVWENLSASTYWTYRVDFGAPSALPTLHWLVGWGQERVLALSHRDYHIEAIAESVLVVVGVGLIVATLARLLHRRSSRRTGRF
jgi:hypothetical protein